jgi:hypothetical protein
MRKHPLLTYNDNHAWPPVWIWTGKGENQFPVGEVGTLKEVHFSVADPNSPQSVKPFNRIYVFIEYRNSSYVGLLPFDDPEACRQIGKILREHCGKSLKEVGDIDLSHFIPLSFKQMSSQAGEARD